MGILDEMYGFGQQGNVPADPTGGLLTQRPVNVPFGMHYGAALMGRDGNAETSMRSLLGAFFPAVQSYGQQLVNNRNLMAQNVQNYLQFQKTGLEMKKLEQDVDRSRLFGEIASKMMSGDPTGNGMMGSITAMSMLDPTNAAKNLIEIEKLRRQQLDKDRSLTGQLKPGEQKIDEKFSGEVVNFISSGAEGKILKQMDVIQTTIDELKNNPEKYYGSALNQIVAGTPIAKDFLTPELANLKETFDGAIQGALRSILGAAYTEQEGRDVLRRGFNVRLKPADNIARMERELKSLESQLANKKRSIEYFQDKGTLRGFQFVLPEKTIPNNNETTNNSFTSSSGKTFEGLQ